MLKNILSLDLEYSSIHLGMHTYTQQHHPVLSVL